MNAQQRHNEITRLRAAMLTSAGDLLARQALELMRLGEAVLVVSDTSGHKALAVASVVAATATSSTLKLDRLRDLAASDVAALLRVGAGTFEPPHPLPRITDGPQG